MSAFALAAALAGPNIEADRTEDAADDLVGMVDDLGPELDLLRACRAGPCS